MKPSNQLSDVERNLNNRPLAYVVMKKSYEVVLIVGDEKNRGEWKKGKLLRLIQGRDGVVRGMRLLHKGHTIERPLQLVPVGNSGSESSHTPTGEKKGRSWTQKRESAKSRSWKSDSKNHNADASRRSWDLNDELHDASRRIVKIASVKFWGSCKLEFISLPHPWRKKELDSWWRLKCYLHQFWKTILVDPLLWNKKKE